LPSTSFGARVSLLVGFRKASIRIIVLYAEGNLGELSKKSLSTLAYSFQPSLDGFSLEPGD
jgi:hypothetical protein